MVHLVLECAPPPDWISNPWLSPTIRLALLGTADPSSPLQRLRGNHHLLHRIMLLALTYREVLEGVSLAWHPYQVARHIADRHSAEQKWSHNLLRLTGLDDELALDQQGIEHGDLVHLEHTQPSDPGLILAAIQKQDYWHVPDLFSEHPPDLRRNKTVVMAAVKRRGEALIRASAHLQSDREVVMLAVEESGCALGCASTELRNDRAVVLKAVSKTPGILKYASDELKRDRCVVLAALKCTGLNLCDASEELRSDHAIVMAAVENCGMALQSASDELRADLPIVRAALRNSDGIPLHIHHRLLLPHVYSTSHNNLWTDLEIREIVGEEAADRMEIRMHERERQEQKESAREEAETLEEARRRELEEMGTGAMFDWDY